MSAIEYITADVAIAAIERCAFTTDDHTIVHCFSGGMGADWDVTSAVDCVRNAVVTDDVPQIAWVDSVLGRCLVVLEGKRQRYFDTVTADQQGETQ